MADDPLLRYHDELKAKVAAWRSAWAHRGEAAGAKVAELVSREYLGQPLSAQIERRLTEGRREIDNQIARFAGTVAAGIALICRAGDTDAIERQTQESFLAVGITEDGFETKMAELAPLIELYRTLSTAVGRMPH